MTLCSQCGYATPVSSRFGLYLCIITGKLKKARDTCNVTLQDLNP